MLRFVNFAYCSDKNTYIEQQGIKNALANETGRDRVLRMFTKNEMGLISPELGYIASSATCVTVIAAFFGGIASMNKTKADFLRRNMGSVYESQHLARRSLVDTITINFFKAAFKSAKQYGVFSSVYLFTTLTIENYRNKISVWEHMGTAAVLGALSRFSYGPKGMLVAGVLGAVLGSIAGGVIMLNLWSTGATMDDFRYWQHEFYYTNILKKKVEKTE